LLDVTRDQIEAYLKERGLEPLRDPSNEDLRFARNRIRHEVLPALERFEPAARRLLARTADMLAEEDAFLESEVDGSDVASIGQLPVALQRRLLRGLHPEMSFEEEEGLRFQVLGGDVVSDEEQVNAAARAGFMVKAQPCSCDPTSFSAKDRIGHVDADSINPPLTVSSRKPGDRVQPLGFPHSKKLQDVLVDAHIPRQLRDRLPIVRDQEGIVWVPGVTVDERRRVTEKTRQQLHLEIIRR
jgi:tRNA(Ile)-lysidine synthase